MNSVPATIFEMWLLKLQEMGRDELKDKIDINSLAVKNQLVNNGAFCGPDQTCQDDLSRTLKAAVDDLTTRLGAEVNAWEYGKMHQVASNHRIFADVKPLARIFNHTAPTPGGTNTVNVARPDHDTFRQTHGPSYRQIIDLSDMNKSVYVGSLGQSGNPLLPHAADQQAKWIAGEYLPMSTDEKDWGKTTVLTLN